MGRNDGGLLFIDSKTAQIKFVKNIDRDSTFIVNRTITAEVLAIDGKRTISKWGAWQCSGNKQT